MKRKEEIEFVLREFFDRRREIVFAYIFGSVLDSQEAHDVDVAVFVDDMQQIGNSFDYTFAMSGELERLLGCPVDVILMNTAPDHLIYSITKGKLILERNAGTRVAFVTASWSRYFDVEVKRRAYLKAIAEESRADEPS